MNKNTTYIVILIALVIVGGAFYFFGFRNTDQVMVPPTQVGDVATSTQYRNNQYGFAVTLPLSWTGYSIVTDTWKGDSINIAGVVSAGTVSGPFISVRHPLWTASSPRQDIPIYVFTIQQWNDMQADKFHIGAAPINPSELARNATYVFALPARYNFAYQTGYEEVQAIIDAKSVTAF